MLPGPPPAVPPGVPGTVPVDLGADPARELARQELSRAVYREAEPDPVVALLQWASRRLDDLLRTASAISPGGGWGLLVLLVLLVAVVLLVRRRFGPARAAAVRQDVLGASELSADEHRRRANGHAAAGRYDEAVRERMRAIVRSLEERTVLAPRRGRTAGDAAREGGRVLPGAATALQDAARLFDETVYGGRPADASTDARMRAADDEILVTRAVPAGPGGPG